MNDVMIVMKSWVRPKRSIFLTGLLLLSFFWISHVNFLLFHSVAEVLSIAIAISVFLLMWNSRKFLQDNDMLNLGIAFLFVGILDSLHMLVYQGMGVFSFQFTANYATQVWIAARLIESTALLLFTSKYLSSIKAWHIFWSYAFITIGLIASIFVWHIFPTCYIEGDGLTLFLKIAEYFIILLIAVAIFKISRHPQQYDKTVYRLLVAAMLMTIASEIVFTIYTGLFGLLNVLGHSFKFLSFVLIYNALIRTSLARPYATIFRELENEKRVVEESESQLSRLIQNLPGVVYHCSFDADRSMIFLSDEVYNLTGYTVEDLLLNRTIAYGNIIHPDDKEHVREHTQKAIEQNEPFILEYRIITAKGQIKYLWEKGRAVTEGTSKIFLEGFISDVTHIKHSALDLVQAQKQYHTLFKHSPNPILIHDGETILDANPATFAALGLTNKNDLIGKNPLTIVHPEDRDRALLRVKTLMSDESPMEPAEFRILISSNSERIVLATPVRINYKAKQAIMITYHDITDSKKAEERLRDSEDRFRTLFEKAPIPYQSLDEAGNLVEINETFLELLGYERDEILGSNFSELLDSKGRQTFKTNFPKFKARGFVKDVSFRLKKKDGNYIDILLDGKTGHYSDGSFKQTHCVFIDISERKRLEEENKIIERQLRRSQRLEAVGTMVGGISHELNNVFQSMLLYGGLVESELPNDGKVITHFRQLLKQGERAKDIVKQILTFSRNTNVEMKPQAIQKLIIESLVLEQASLPANIKIIQNIDPNCGMILCDNTQIHQIMLNLCNNAGYAMRSEGGILTVSLLQISAVLVEGQPEVQVVELKVGDNGDGMEDETIEKIFDPFFTTKDIGSGTGLGLSVIHGIVKMMEGQITVQSQVDQGTTFRLLFPVIDEAEEQIKILDSTSAAGPSKSILLVDDDDNIRKVTGAILISKGFKVEEASDGLEALSLFKSNPERHNLIVTDLSMPKMTGTELAAEIRKLNPSIPIILSTGHLGTGEQDEFRESGISGSIKKPWTIDQLIAKINDL